MAKTKSAGERKSAKRAAGSKGKAHRPLDMEAIRGEISRLVGRRAVNLVDTAISEANKGQYAAMKYLFEMIGLYPAGSPESPAGEDSLAKTLLQRLGLPENPAVETAVTKDSARGGEIAGSDPVE